MKTWVKIAIGGAGGVVLLIAVALAALRWAIDPEDYHAEIDAAVTHAIGRDITIDGPIGLSVLPWPAVHFGQMTIANAPDFGDQPLARIHSARVTLRLLPLFTGRLELGTLDIDGLDLALVRHDDGHTNWQSIVQSLSAAAPTPEHAPDRRHVGPPDTALPLSSLKISAVEVDNADIRYDDTSKNRHYRFADAELETGRISNGQPFRLEAGGDLGWPDSNLTAAVHLVARIEPNVANRFYRFSDLTMNVLARGQAVPGGEQEANFGASGDIDLEAGRFGLDDVSLQSAGLSVTGHIDGTGLNDRLAYNGRITVAGFSPRSVLRQLHRHSPAMQSGSALSRASFDAQFEGGAQAVSFTQVAARLDDSTLRGTVSVRDFSAPHYSFDLYLDTLDIDDYLPPGSTDQARTNRPARGDDKASRKATEFDLWPLHHLSMQGRLHIGSLTLADLHIGNAVAALSVGHNGLHVAPLTADLYGGSLRLIGAVDASGSRPDYALTGRLRGVALAPLLDDAVASHRVAGSADADVDLHAGGHQVARIKRTLSGTARLALTNGRINGVDLGDMLLEAQTRAHSRAHTDGRGKTAFKRLAGHFSIDNGVVSSQDLRLGAGVLGGRGKARYSLPDNRLDATLRLAVAATADQRLAPLAGLSVPMHLQGTLLAPTYTIDMRHAATDKAPTANPGK